MPNGLALAVILLVIMLFLAYIVSIILNFLTPFYSTPKKVAKRIVDLFELSKDDSFADLGSGDGRMIFMTYNRYKCKSVGYEISPVLLVYFKIRKALTNPMNRKIELKEESFFTADLSNYNVVYCCLPQDLLILLEKKFTHELKKGSKVFTYRNQLPNRNGKKFLIEDKEVYQYTF